MTPKDLPENPSIEELATATATALIQAAAGTAFELFRAKQFRRLAKFPAISQEEQDRIFNELMVAFIVLLMLLLEAPDLNVDDETRHFLKSVHGAIPQAHVAHLQSLGLEAEHLKDWQTLISMRYEEYARDRHDVRAAAMQARSAEKNLDLDELSNIQLLLPVQTAAIGCHHHICRGETAGLDDLFKLVLKSLSRFYVELRVRFEGGRITPMTRAKAAARRLYRK